jgi:hypothetical protein
MPSNIIEINKQIRASIKAHAAFLLEDANRAKFRGESC